jgi:ribonuclease E
MPDRRPQPVEFEGIREAIETSADVDAPRPVAAFDLRPTLVEAERPMPRPANEEPTEPLPIAQPVAAAVSDQPAVTQPEPSRRRSTVRERAPDFGGEQAAVQPSALSPAEPVSVAEPPAASEPASTGEADENRPRRTGWWSRKAVSKG